MKDKNDHSYRHGELPLHAGSTYNLVESGNIVFGPFGFIEEHRLALLVGMYGPLALLVITTLLIGLLKGRLTFPASRLAIGLWALSNLVLAAAYWYEHEALCAS